jgi:shikimate 5-dehydrogenase/3-dehydroquinate dehydratase, type I
VICLTLSGSTLEENLREVQNNIEYIDMCELRLDTLSPEQQKRASEFPSMVSVPVIATFRRSADGGKCTIGEKSRRNLLFEALDGDFAYVDIEDDVKKCELEDKARERGIKIIRSYHDFKGIPTDIFGKIANMAKRADVVKIAVMTNSVQDLLTLLKIKNELGNVQKIVIGMGEYGVPARILYHKFGSMLTFASPNAVAPGQLTPRELKTVYAADKVNDQTAVYGIIGNPVLHTQSPKIHNPGFRGIRYNAVYVPFPVDDIRTFFVLAEEMKMRGFSVTIPHKVSVLSYLGNITREVKQIGACNTVVRMPQLWKGMNTDYYGFLSTIESEIESGKIRNALVVGAGGASNSIVWALRNQGINVTILNRTLAHAEKLATNFRCAYDSLENAKKYEGKVDLIVQTTSVGLAPTTGFSPLEGFRFTGREICYDIIYEPKVTKFLSDAMKAGCKVHYGSEMLIAQGKLQFEAFTGYHFPKDVEIDLES